MTRYLVILLLFSTSAFALEADQYRYWTEENLPDASSVVNTFLNNELQWFLDHKINRDYSQPGKVPEKFFSKYTRYRQTWLIEKKPFSCETVSKKFLRHIRPHFFKDRLVGYLEQKAGDYLYPRKQRFFKDYQESIYRGVIWPPIMPVAQTLIINQVAVGTDKIHHFFSSGKRYLRTYYAKRKKGYSHQEASLLALEYGLTKKEEKGWLGLWTSGTFSYADLEANYQGMVLGIAMCRGEAPLLQLKRKKWVINNPINMKSYVNPLWDEAFNNSYYAGYRRHSFKKIIRNDYCHLAQSRKITKSWKQYRQRIHIQNHDRYLKKLIDQKIIPDPAPFSIASICSFSDPLYRGMSLWTQK